MSNFSVNTNVAAFVALQNLSLTSAQLDITQNRISTGLRVSSAKDDASTYAIAQGQRAEVGGLRAVNQSLNHGKSVVDVALAAAESISDILIRVKEKTIAKNEVGLSASSVTALTNDIDKLLEQVDNIADNADFDGINLADGSGTIAALSSTDPAASTINIAGIDLRASSAAGLNISSASTIAQIDAALAAVNAAAAEWGSGSQGLDVALTFNKKLSDTIEAGIGNLVDADLARESARLQSLQVKQQLGAQALTIANQAPQVILGLFRG